MQVSPFAYSMRRDREVVWGYTVLWMLYSIQSFFPTPIKTLSPILTFFLIAVSVGYALYCHRPYVWRQKGEAPPVVLLALDLLLLALIVYNLIYIFNPRTSLLGTFSVNTYGHLHRLLGAMLPLYFYYYYAHKGVVDEKMFRQLFFPCLVVGICDCIAYEKMILSLAPGKSTDGLFTNNGGYNIVILLPLVLSFRKSKFIVIPFFLFSLCFVLTLFSMKRGAILIASVSLFFFILLMLKENATKRFQIITVSFTLLMLLGFLSFLFYECNDAFHTRIEETMAGNLSRRDQIWGALVRYFMIDMNDIQSVFGNGINTTFSVTQVPGGSHNDWIHILFEYGMFGVLFYALFSLSLAKKFFDMRKVSPYAFCLSMMLFTNMVVRMCTSRFIFDIECSPVFMLLLGFVLSLDSPRPLSHPIQTKQSEKEILK